MNNTKVTMLNLTNEQLINIALGAGFSSAAIINVRDLVFDPYFRDCCKQNYCGKYGANYSCPPDCGTFSEMKNKITARSKALALQTLGRVPDISDDEAVIRARAYHNEASFRLARILRLNPDEFVLAGAGYCALCNPCAVTENKPCRFPDKRYSCMSAYCVNVKDLAEKCGMPYQYADGVLPLFGLLAFD
ncbi:MAG: DUF2284 domain-containing protein [Christensenellaceae bacterium]|nr:DUF2284 domain-containing protein [Christensenellaceae bacterium]